MVDANRPGLLPCTRLGREPARSIGNLFGGRGLDVDGTPEVEELDVNNEAQLVQADPSNQAIEVDPDTHDGRRPVARDDLGVLAVHCQRISHGRLAPYLVFSDPLRLPARRPQHEKSASGESSSSGSSSSVRDFVHLLPSPKAPLFT